MRILYLANARIPTPRAYGLQIMQTCAALSRAGADIELAFPARSAGKGEEPFSYYGIKPHFTCLSLSVPDFLSWGPAGFAISALWFAERARFLKSFFTADIIYSRDALVLAQYVLLGRRLVFEAHAAPNPVSRFVARRAYRVIVISKGLKDAYVRAGVRAEDIVVAPDAVDAAMFNIRETRSEARAALSLPEADPILLYAGHLYPRKGAGTLARAASELPDVKAVFVGGTAEDISAFKRRWGSTANISILGQVPHERIPLYLRAADVLVLPNSGKDVDASAYTSPMKLFEYMASGTPILASDVPALREILDESTASFFSPDDPTSLADAARGLLTETEHAAARAARAKAQVRTWDMRAGEIHAALGSEK